MISVDVAELLRGVFKTALDFAMKLLLSTLSVVNAEDLTVDEADKSFLDRSVVGESMENEAIEGGFVEGNSG